MLRGEFDSKDRGAPRACVPYLWVNDSTQPRDQADAPYSLSFSRSAALA
jgi:hypothetical protein